jgi:four helix bundle protein
MSESQKGNIVVDKSFELALGILDFCELLNSNGKSVVARQLIRSGTAVGALIAESQHAESRADFVHKMKIALKENNETLYWLSLCEKSNHLPFDPKLKGLSEELVKIISKIIISSRNG